MATLLHLEGAGHLLRLDPALGMRQQEMRRVYVLPRVAEWFMSILPTLGSTWNIEESPIEQIDAMIADSIASLERGEGIDGEEFFAELEKAERDVSGILR